METIKGRIWKFGDDITPTRYPQPRYLILQIRKSLAEHVMEEADPWISLKS